MSTVIVSIETQGTTPVTAPAGTVLAGLSISLSGGAYPAQVVVAAPFTASFVGVAPGEYTANVQAVDANGNALGVATASAQFTVQPDVSIDVPTVTTVSVSVQ